MKKIIIKLLSELILKNYNEQIKNLELETPPKKDLWDYAFPCFQLSRNLKKSPNIIAEELKVLISKDSRASQIIEETNVAWAYLNIKINKLNIIEAFRNYNLDFFWSNNTWKTIIIDYIWANVWKPLHIGHMCTPNQGQVMINIYRKLGYNVISDSHIGDWGIIFWKLITAYKSYWDSKRLKQNAVEHLFELYVKISDESLINKDLETDFREEFKLLSSWNLESRKLWESFTKESINSMNKQLARLNVKPDYNIWESFYEWLNLPKIENYPDLDFSMKDIVTELLEKWIATKNEDNSVWVIFPEELKIPSCILQKRDWTHWYLASDLASVKYRVNNWSPEKIIYFVDVRQQLHLRQTFIIADNAGWIDKGKLFHAYNWFISLKDWAMSTRKWKIIKLNKLLDEAEDRAEKIILEKRDDIKWEELKKLSKIIWIWAIKYGYLKKSRETDVVFDWDEFMTFEWNSWPYIQYAYVRASRILEKHWLSKSVDFADSYEDVKEKLKDESLNLMKLLLSYNSSDWILTETAQKNMPHILAAYSYELTKSFNAFYNNVEVLKEENKKLKDLVLILTKNFAKTIKDCFALLWIDMPNKM